MKTPKKTPTRSGVSAVVERHIPAPPQVVYDLVADVTRMGEWSPETTEAEWIDGATGPAVGARFRGRNTLGKNSWSTKPTVVAAERGREFSFEVPGKAGPRWRYQFVAEGDGTRVTESVDQSTPSPALIRFFQRRAGVTDRSAHLEHGMAITLDRVAVAAARLDATAIT